MESRESCHGCRNRIGTRGTHDIRSVIVNIRPATHADIDTIVRIIAHYAAQGIMLPRSHTGLAESLSNYVVADVDGQVVGCGGLEQYSSSTAEIFGLATSPNKPMRGTGSAIVEALIAKARCSKIAQVFALTLAPAFFQKMGFRTVQHTDLPMKVWKDCIACPKYGNCDEIAMVLDLN
ncbi:MAG: N-acetyltransferase [Acidobacteria bacterium]|nr:MAG: N-acetyltransferase [Acidobacteriota bacterium]